jgi:hypothetical protein
VFQEQETTI